MRTLQFESEILASTRILTVHYDLPEDQWSPIRLHAVKLGKAKWIPEDEHGNNMLYTIVDILPILDKWNIAEIESRIKAHEQHLAEQEMLAA